MIILSDDILNKYLDGELSREIIIEIEDTIKNSPKDRRRLFALQETDRSLKNLKVTEVKSDFTSLIMKKIQRSLQSNQEQKKFIISIMSFFVLMCLIIAGSVGFEIIRNLNPVTTSGLRNSIKFITSASEYMANIFNSRNISIIGEVFSFGLIISAWFFFDYSKMLRKAGK